MYAEIAFYGSENIYFEIVSIHFSLSNLLHNFELNTKRKINANRSLRRMSDKWNNEWWKRNRKTTKKKVPT